MSNSKDQMTSLHDKQTNNDNLQKESSNLDYDFNNTSQKSSSITTSPANNFDQEKRSISSTADDDDEPRSMIIQSSSHSDIDLSQQLDEIQLHEDNTSPEPLPTVSASESEEKFETPQKQFDNDNNEKILPVLVPEDEEVILIDSLLNLLAKNRVIFDVSYCFSYQTWTTRPFRKAIQNHHHHQ